MITILNTILALRYPYHNLVRQECEGGHLPDYLVSLVSFLQFNFSLGLLAMCICVFSVNIEHMVCL